MYKLYVARPTGLATSSGLLRRSSRCESGNEFGDHNLNVVKLNSVLTQPDSPEVGILASGKMGTPRARNKISKPGQS